MITLMTSTGTTWDLAFHSGSCIAAPDVAQIDLTWGVRCHYANHTLCHSISRRPGSRLEKLNYSVIYLTQQQQHTRRWGRPPLHGPNTGNDNAEELITAASLTALLKLVFEARVTCSSSTSMACRRRSMQNETKHIPFFSPRKHIRQAAILF